MARSAYPTADNLSDFLTDAGLLASITLTATSLTDAANAAAQRWERETGYVPFLARAESRRFDPPGPERGPVGIYTGLNNVGGSRKLFLDGGLLSVTALQVNVTDLPLLVPPTTYVLNQDFFLRPAIAQDEQRPYSWIEFRVPQYGNPRSIQVSGEFGFCRELPPDAWGAILRAGALELLPSVAQRIHGGASSWAVGTEREQLDHTLSGLRDDWDRYYRRVLGIYRRVRMA